MADQSQAGRTQATVFGEVAELYHLHRPDYPAELFEWMADLAGLDPQQGHRVLDVGCGTGKSSAWFLQRGHPVTGLEPDADMAAVAMKHPAAVDLLHIASCSLEAWDHEGAPYRLAVSGQAWHWMNPAERFDQVARALEPRGWLCVFWNRPSPPPTAVAEGLAEVYDSVVGHVPGRLHAVRFPGSKAAVSAATPVEEFEASGRFGPVATFAVETERLVSTAEHCATIRTQSDHRMLGTSGLDRLEEEIGAAIDRLGGEYSMTITTHGYAAPVGSLASTRRSSG